MAVVNLRFCYRIAGITGNNPNAQIIGTTYTIQPNSCFEPLDTAATQPYGFDQMASLYAKYKVLSATVEIQASTSGVSGITNVLTVMAQSPTGGATLAGVAGDVAAARPNVSVAVVPTLNPVTWRRKYVMHELLGVTKNEFDANVEEYAAPVGANPTQMPLIELGCFNLNGNFATSGISTLIFVYQTVQFFGRIGQPGS